MKSRRVHCNGAEEGPRERLKARQGTEGSCPRNESSLASYGPKAVHSAHPDYKQVYRRIDVNVYRKSTQGRTLDA
jgi:hypothetical protein